MEVEIYSSSMMSLSIESKRLPTKFKKHLFNGNIYFVLKHFLQNLKNMFPMNYICVECKSVALCVTEFHMISFVFVEWEFYTIIRSQYQNTLFLGSDI